jgi:hypothetical protein
MTAALPYRNMLAELLALWDARHEDGGTVLKADLSHPATGVVIRGLTAHAVAASRGVLTLYKASQQIAALPLVRAVIEDAMTATWVYKDPEGWKMFIAAGEQQRVKALRNMIDQGIDPEATAKSLQEAQAVVDSVEKITHVNIENRFRVVDPTGRAYLHYRIASSLIHAGPALVDRYTTPAPETPIGLAYKKHPSHAAGNEWMAFTVHYLAQALQVWDLCQVSRPDRDALNDFARRLGVASLDDDADTLADDS